MQFFFLRFTLKLHVACNQRVTPSDLLVYLIFMLLFVEAQEFCLLSVYMFCFWKFCVSARERLEIWRRHVFVSHSHH